MLANATTMAEALEILLNNMTFFPERNLQVRSRTAGTVDLRNSKVEKIAACLLCETMFIPEHVHARTFCETGLR